LLGEGWLRVRMKWVEILKELAPAITRVGFLFNPTTARGGGSYFRWRMAVSRRQCRNISIPSARV